MARKRYRPGELRAKFGNKLADFFIAAFDEMKKAGKDCKCGGACPCHILGQIGGQACPPYCKNYSRFDGCHRCDPTCGS
jgi:hypothetical protein